MRQSTSPHAIPSHGVRLCRGGLRVRRKRPNISPTPKCFRQHELAHILGSPSTAGLMQHSLACPRPTDVCVEGFWSMWGSPARVVVAAELPTVPIGGVQLPSEKPQIESLSCGMGLLLPFLSFPTTPDQHHFYSRRRRAFWGRNLDGAVALDGKGAENSNEPPLSRASRGLTYWTRGPIRCTRTTVWRAHAPPTCSSKWFGAHCDCPRALW